MKTIEFNTKLGKITGEELEYCYVFRGIPYAKAKRWEKPTLVDKWDRDLDATQFGPCAPQVDMSKDPFYGKEFYTDPNFPLPRQDEDCLYLNIWVPKNPKEDKSSVALWIHGGAFDHGFGHEMEFDGEAFAKSDVVLVTINYRVGVLGFLALEELFEKDKTTGNYGILDQIASLEWVNKYIEDFGGNKDDVTVFGQSAGAISTQTLLSSLLTKGLIHKAIIQSGGGYHNHLTRAHHLEKAYEIGHDVLDLCGVSSVEELKKVDSQKFVDILPELYERHDGLTFRPVIDDYVLTMQLDEVIRQKQLAPVPILIGSTANDVTVRPGRDGQDSPLYIGCMNLAFARHEKTYIYYFSHTLPGDSARSFHSSELWYMFGTLGRSWRPMVAKDYTLSRHMVIYWTNFIKTGIPDYYWPACNIEQKIPYIKTLE